MRVAVNVPCIFDGEKRNGIVSLADALDTGEILSSPVVVELVSTDLIITNVTINTAIKTIEGISVAIGQAVEFHVEGQLVNKQYTLLITAVSSSTPSQTIKGKVKFIVGDSLVI